MAPAPSAAHPSAPANAAPGPARSWWPWLLLLVLLPLPIYLRAIPFGLLGIDESLYFFSPLLDQGGPRGLWLVWSQRWYDDYAPVSLLTLWLDRALGDGLHWHSARIQAALWHSAGALALFALARRLTGSRAALAVAALYAVHPLCGEAVLWLAERKNLVALALSFACLERYLAWRQEGGSDRARNARAAAAVALGLLALLAKPHAVALPALMAAWECTLATDSWRNRLRALALPVAAVAAYTAYQLHIRQDIGHDASDLLGGGRLAALWCDGDILARYLLRVVVPLDLTIYYPVIEDPARVARLAGAWLAVAATVAATVLLARRRRLVACAWLLALAGLLPALNLVAQAAPMTDHYEQWALPGLLLVLVTVVADRCPGCSPRAAVLACAPIVLALATLAWLRVDDFAGPDAFFRSAYAKQPDAAMNQAGYALVLARVPGPESRAAGPLALAAVRNPAHRRILMATVIDATILAGVECWRTEGGRAPALALVQQVQPGAGPDCGLYVWTRILLATGGEAELAEADADLVHALGPDVLAAAADLGPRCADGAHLPDHFPPLLRFAPPPGADDGFWAGLARQDHLRLALALADARERQRRDDDAFALAALALNLDPQDLEARTATARLYAKRNHPDAARALLGGP